MPRRPPLEAARQVRADLDTGTGVWAGTESGQAVRDLAEARAARHWAESTAEYGARWRDRHAARNDAAAWARREADARQRCEAHVGSEIVRLDQEIARHQETLDQTAARLHRREVATEAAIDHGLEQRRVARKLADRVTEGRDHLDGVPPADIRRAATRREQLRSLGSVPEHELPTRPSLSIEV